MAEVAEINNRVAFLRSIFDSNREAPQKYIIEEFNKRFGHGVSFVAIKKCREAHAKGKFSEVAVPVFTRMLQKGIKVTEKASKKVTKKVSKKAAKKVTKKAAKKTTKKTAKKASTKASAPAPTPVVAAASATESKKKSRGERREKYERRGRRKSDKGFVELSSPSNHLVLVTQEGRVVDHRFKAKRDAEECINGLISSGTSPAKITYYTRQEIAYKISL